MVCIEIVWKMPFPARICSVYNFQINIPQKSIKPKRIMCERCVCWKEYLCDRCRNRAYWMPIIWIYCFRRRCWCWKICTVHSNSSWSNGASIMVRWWETLAICCWSCSMARPATICANMPPNFVPDNRSHWKRWKRNDAKTNNSKDYWPKLNRTKHADVCNWRTCCRRHCNDSPNIHCCLKVWWK